MRHFVIVLILATLLTTNNTSSATQEPSIPFIYYYSVDDAAFIVERADGTERRILASFQITSDDSGTAKWVVGPGWSASGQWFAWTILETFMGSMMPAPPLQPVGFIVNRDGGSILSLIEQDTGFTRVSMEWSPVTTDYLAVQRAHFPARAEDGYPDFEKVEVDNFIFDPVNQQITLALSNDPEWNGGDEWTPDGMYLARYSGWQASSDREMLLVPVDGASPVRRAYSIEGWCSDRSSDGVSWSSASTALYLRGARTLTVEDFGTTGQFDIGLPDGFIQYIDWNPTGEYVLLYISSDCENPTAELWLLSIQAQTLQPLLDNARIIREREYFDYYFEANTVTETSAWSPDGRHSFAVSEDAQLFLVTPAPLGITEMNAISVEDITLANWGVDSLYFLASSNGNTLYQLDSATGIATEIATPTDASFGGEPNYLTISDGMANYFSLSSNNRYIAYQDFGDNHDIRILDLVTGKTTDIRLQTPFEQPYVTYRVDWHPNGDWLFLEGDLTGPNVRFLNIMSADGSIQRELVTCWQSPACFGWLSEMLD